MTYAYFPANLEALMLLALFFLLTFVLGVVATATSLAPRARRDAREIDYLRRRLATSDDLGRSESVRSLRSVALQWANGGPLWATDARLLLSIADKLERGESLA